MTPERLDEIITQIASSRKGKKRGRPNPGFGPKAKPVLQFYQGNFYKRYGSMQEAARQTGMSNSTISNCCNGKQKEAKGFTFHYE